MIRRAIIAVNLIWLAVLTAAAYHQQLEAVRLRGDVARLQTEVGLFLAIATDEYEVLEPGTILVLDQGGDNGRP